MPVTVAVEGLSVVHATSDGVVSGFCNLCLTPVPPVPRVPIPYPSLSQSSDASDVSKHVTCDGNGVCLKDSSFATSTGDKPGSDKGVMSGKVSGKTQFLNASLTVKFEGKAVVRALDLATFNDKNGPPAPVLQGPIVMPPDASVPCCLICGKPAA